MLKLKVIEKNGDEYELEDNSGKRHKLNIQLYDIDEDININDYINISAELLNPMYMEYTKQLILGNLKHICGKSDISIDDNDVIILEKNQKQILLKRLYG